MCGWVGSVQVTAHLTSYHLLPSLPLPLLFPSLLSLTAVLPSSPTCPYFVCHPVPPSLPPSLPLSLQVALGCHYRIATKDPKTSPRCTRSNVRPTTRSWRDTETAQTGQYRPEELICCRCITVEASGRICIVGKPKGERQLHV